MSRGRQLRGVLVLVLSLALLWVALLLQPEGPSQSADPRPSSYNNGPEGLKAWYLLEQRVGHPVLRWSLPPEELPKDRALVAAIGTGSSAPDKAESQALLDWVEGGGRLILLCGVDTQITLALGLKLNTNGTVGSVLHPAFPTRLLDGIGEIRPGAARATTDRLALVPHFADGDGLVVGEFPLGRGRVVLVTDPGLFSNRWLGVSDNATLALSLAGGRQLCFGELYQGYRSSSSLWAQLPAPGRWAIVQLLVPLALAAWTVSRRFGTPLDLKEEPRGAGHFLRSMADLLQRAKGGRGVAAEILGARFREDLAASVGLPVDAADAELAGAASRRIQRPAEPLIHLLGRLRQAATDPKAIREDRDLVSVARSIHEYREELSLNVRPKH